MQQEIVHIYDKIFKRIINLSDEVVLNFMGGLFKRSFSPKDIFTYNSTENVNNELERTVADAMITIGKERFHMEVQINFDTGIALRVLDYGFRESKNTLKKQGNEIKLEFPEPTIILLEHTPNTPNEMIIELQFLGQGLFEYKVPIIKLLDYTSKDLVEHNMIIMLPFRLLKLRNTIKKDKSIQMAKALKIILNDEILTMLEYGRVNGNITNEDYYVLIGLVDKLYKHLYGDIEIFKQEGVSNMLQEELILQHEEIREEERKKAVNEKIEGAKELLNVGFEVTVIAHILKLPVDIIKQIKAGFNIEEIKIDRYL